uniref:Uncharacterized protein n=1 Tax=Prevotella sp. GTC17254 TaxID=3236794 RepID=A0AB33J3L9_9BACT
MEGSLDIRLNIPLSDMAFLDKVAKSRGWLMTEDKSKSDEDQTLAMKQKLERVESLFGALSKSKAEDWKSEKETYLRKKYL